MPPIVVTDIRQLDVQLRTPDLVRFYECALAMYKIDGKPYYIKNKAGVATHVLEYGKVRGLRNLTGLAAYTLTFRKNKRMTQAQLSAASGVPVHVISQIENSISGDSEVISPEYVWRVATCLGFSAQQALKLR